MYTRSGNQGAKQFRFRSRDTNLVVCYLDTLSQRAQVIPPIAAGFTARALQEKSSIMSGVID
ncbi:hypothetical protein [Bradyrhizobium sp. AS23.2]|uniref:hypothetical protein n=1 Tax=Bradyrhizobium sp. AS23.2 TaxID=1680155 RepID=UPI00093AA953|nr:hypothetical protein [Bradyrhizobium sp. AS23.2]OKO68267.1 hypothetical protein AC630_39035 [Bradyrhizobium sp. AS23.2]